MARIKKGVFALAIGALGVVFGDIGTSPLYAVQAVFGSLGAHVPISTATVHGIISVIIWSVTTIVSIKYIGFIMRADNKGEGGIMALVALAKSSKNLTRFAPLLIALGLVGVTLFYGDSMITPAISVLAAVEGLHVIAPQLSNFIIPITLVILVTLFWIQRYGSRWVGSIFGPVMLVWFSVIGIGGAAQVWQHPQILGALSPVAAFQFFTAQPLVAFLAMGAVVLAVTGAEALYADMGHFGRKPIARAWFWLVFPALVLCYMGQGALLLQTPSNIASPFFLLFPEALRTGIVILATFATLIASQSVISGAFSLTRQAIQLDFLPKMKVLHTSAKSIGQVFLPFVNGVLFVLVTILVLSFRSSASLANAFGMAVSFTLAIDTLLFAAVAGLLWKKSRWYVATVLALFLPLDLLFLTSNLSKFTKGGWFPLLIAALLLLIIKTWIDGQRIIHGERRAAEGKLQTFILKLQKMRPQITRVPGQAVYIAHHAGYAPLALHAAVDNLHELHEKVVIVHVRVTTASHIPLAERAKLDELQFADGICYLELSYGFHDIIDVPKTLARARRLSPELDFDPYQASYFVSLAKVVPVNRPNLAGWRKTLYALMARNAFSTSDYYKLPIERTVEMRSLLKL